MERVVIEALELLLVPPTNTDPDNTTDNNGILCGLVMLAKECPRLVSSCAPAVVDKLCTPGFLESAFRAHAASKIASQRAAGDQAWGLRELAALFLQRAPLLHGEQLRALIAIVTPTGILRPPPRLATPNSCAPGPPIVTMNGSVAVGGDEVHSHEPALWGGGGGQQEGVHFQRLAGSPHATEALRVAGAGRPRMLRGLWHVCRRSLLCLWRGRPRSKLLRGRSMTW